MEVSSPGIERILRKEKHLEQNIGKKVEVKLFKKDDRGKKIYCGILNSFNNETLEIKEEDSSIKIERKNIAQVKTIYDW